MTGRSISHAILRGLRIGAESDYPFTAEPAGLEVVSEAPQIRPAFRDGARWLGADRVDPVTLTFEVRARGERAATLPLGDELKAAWGPVRSDVVPLTLNLNGDDRVMYGRPRRGGLDIETARFGTIRARLVFEATDPRMFDASESSLVLGLTAGGGFMFPLTFPLTFGAGGDSDGAALNAGTFETDWTATIVGPVTTPRITLGSTGEFVELDGTIPDGSSLTVMSVDGAVLLNGSPRQSWVTLPSTFFKLPAGSNTIRFRAASGTGTCTFSWRSAWL